MTKKADKSHLKQTQVLTVEKVSRWLRIPKSTLYKLCQERRLPVTKIGRHWRFDRKLIEEWLRDRMTNQAEEQSAGSARGERTKKGP